jgi:predicted hydrocarbon binding protein
MAISYIYDFGKQLDLAKIKTKLKMNSLEGDKNLLFLFVDPLFLTLFKDGRLRIIHKDRDVNSLRKALTIIAPKLREIIQEIAKSSGVKKNVDSILADGDIEKFPEALEVFGRPRLSTVGFLTFRELNLFSPEKVLGPYQRERIATQAGETIGRRLAKVVKDRKELETKLLDLIENESLGIPSTLSPEKAEKINEEIQKPYSIIRVLESTSYGIVPEGKPMCDLIKGLIRGAYCEYLGQENVNVVETRCWGLGDVYCEFRVYILKM